jgi:hypothetical protein
VPSPLQKPPQGEYHDGEKSHGEKMPRDGKEWVRVGPFWIPKTLRDWIDGHLLEAKKRYGSRKKMTSALGYKDVSSFVIKACENSKRRSK